MATFDDVMRELEATRAEFQKKTAGDVRLAALERALNAMSVRVGRPGAVGAGEGDGRASAQAWLEAKHLSEQPKRGTLQPFNASSELIDAAVTARSALVKMISLGALDAGEQKALSLFNMGGSGYIVPPEWSSRIIQCIQELADVLGAVFTQSIGGPSLHFFVDDAQPEATWACETDCLPPQGQDLLQGLGALELKAEELRFSTCATRALIEDAAIDLEAWLLGKATTAFRRALAAAVLIGDGNGKPVGILNPASGIPVCNVSSATPAGTITWQDLVSIWATLPAAYRPNASWVMNSLTLGKLLTISDAAGRPIVLPGLSGAAPLSLMGRPILIDERMPNVAAGATPILIADLRALYCVVLRSGPTLLPPIVSYCIAYNFSQRAGGGVMCADAGRLLRVG